MRVKKRTMLWIVWVILWIVGSKMLAGMGVLHNRSVVYLLIEALISCFASTVMIRHKLIKWIIFVYLGLNLVFCFNIVGFFCFGMSMWLYYITKKHTQPTTWDKTVFRKKRGADALPRFYFKITLKSCVERRRSKGNENSWQ